MSVVSVTLISVFSTVAFSLHVKLNRVETVFVAVPLRVTCVPAWDSCSTVTSGPASTTGAVVSARTMMLMVSVALYWPSLTIRVTVVFPTGKSAVGVGPVAEPPVQFGSGLNALRLSENHILLAYNDSKDNRENLSLAVLDENGGNLLQSFILEKTPGEEFSYPYMIRTWDGLIHLLYTWKRKRIKHVIFIPRDLPTPATLFPDSPR